MVSPGNRLDIRCGTAARLLGSTNPAAHGADAADVALRVAHDGRFAALGTAPRQPRSHEAPPTAPPAHPSWTVAAVAGLPDPVARRFLDRLGPHRARAVLSTLDPERADRLRAGPVAPAGTLVEALLGRRMPPVFPPPPSWAAPPGDPDAVARAAAREPEWPAATERWEAAERRAAAAARRARVAETPDPEGPGPDDEPARGLARLAFALLDRPDEVWGLAGAWPRPDGLALLAAWNAWPDLGALDPDAATARTEAARRLHERWSAWAA